jgi:acyl carrier protein
MKEDWGMGIRQTTPLEGMLCRIFAEVLDRAEVNVDDDFFDVGGDSLLAIRVMHRVNKETGAKTPVKAIFSQPTAAGLAKRITVQTP